MLTRYIQSWCAGVYVSGVPGYAVHKDIATVADGCAVRKDIATVADGFVVVVGGGDVDVIEKSER